MSEWQGHLLSCCGQLKTANILKNQTKFSSPRCGDCDFTGANYLVLKSHRAFTHIPKSQDEDQENIPNSQEEDQEPKLESNTGNQLFDIQVQYPHIQIQGANQVEKSDKELKVNPADYPHIKINFLPSKLSSLWFCVIFQ